MNFFFGIKNNEFSSKIQIPTFQNRSGVAETISLFKAYTDDNKWKIEELKNKQIDKHFFLLNEEDTSNTDIYFLANKKDIENYDGVNLLDFNKFTDTSPSFRSNFKIILKNGGFSSYQSEYINYD